jgi:hypothetical protein
VQREIELVFDDAAGGGLSSDGRCVFSVESRTRDLVPGGQAIAGGRDVRRSGNSLAAHDLDRKGGLRWSLPRDGADAAADAWYLGAPLVVGEGRSAARCSGRGDRGPRLVAAAGGIRRGGTWRRPGT